MYIIYITTMKKYISISISQLWQTIDYRGLGT